MSNQRARLLTPTFISLYIATTGAIVLDYFRDRYGQRPWFPVAVGAVAALAIIPLKSLLLHRLTDPSRGDWGRIVFFCLCGVLPFVAFPFLGREDWLLICAALLVSALFFWAAAGTLFRWPGFRRPPNPDDCCVECGHDLTGHEGGACPGCGMAIDVESEQMSSTDAPNGPSP